MEYHFMVIDVLIALITIGLSVVLYYKWSYTYWDRKKVPTIKPKFPYGNIRSFSNIKEPEYLAIYRCYRELRDKGQRHGGIYAMTKPLYLPADAEIVKNILITDFHYFYDRAIYSNEKYDPLSAHLLALEGQRWRNMRIKLTPAFTSGKMKTMFNTMLQCSEQLSDALKDLSSKSKPVDIKEMMACYTTDIIGSCAFGIDCNSFKDPDPEFRRYGRKIFYVTKLRHFQRFLATSFPNFSRNIGIRALPSDVSQFFMTMIRKTVEHRRENNVRRNDLLQILIDLNQELSNNQNPFVTTNVDDLNGYKPAKRQDSDGAKRPLTMTEIASNSFIFFFGGFETSSTTMSFVFYELSQHPELQEKVRDEINEVLAKYGGRITYESLFEMKYMRQVFDETLRKYPVTSTMKRMCTEDYKVPGTDVIIEKGTGVFISAYGLQRDPEYFPDPDKFDPERFSDENKGNIKAGSYLGFGDGPRICIGKRFGLMQMTVGVTKVLRTYRVKLNPRTMVPIEFDPNSFIIMPKGGIWIELEKI